MVDFISSVSFGTMTCGHKDCGVTFALTSRHVEQLKISHETFYCPNGHPRHFPGESDLEKERRLRQRAEQRVEEEAQRASRYFKSAQHQERRASTFKGHCTRIRKKVAAGKCPCCDDTTFRNLRRHMLKHHPAWQPDAEPLTPEVMTP